MFIERSLKRKFYSISVPHVPLLTASTYLKQPNYLHFFTCSFLAFELVTCFDGSRVIRFTLKCHTKSYVLCSVFCLYMALVCFYFIFRLFLFFSFTYRLRAQPADDEPKNALCINLIEQNLCECMQAKSRATRV